MRSLPEHAALVAVACMASAGARVAEAQIRASELASVSQVIDGTRLTVEYSRPRMRGRAAVFGVPRAVTWGEVWTPGANWATTLDVSRDVRLNGHPVPKGKYSVWMVVRPSGDWTAILDPRAHRFHEDRPDSTAAQIRFAVHADSAPPTDVLTWSFPVVRPTGATLVLQWATTRVAIDVGVTPTFPLAMPVADAQAYVGTYAFRETTPGEFRSRTTFIVRYADSVLTGEWVPAHPYFKRFAMIRVAPDVFVPGLYDASGQVYEVLRPEVAMQFRRVAGRPVAFDVRDQSDSLWASGTRRP